MPLCTSGGHKNITFWCPEVYKPSLKNRAPQLGYDVTMCNYNGTSMEDNPRSCD